MCSDLRMPSREGSIQIEESGYDAWEFWKWRNGWIKRSEKNICGVFAQTETAPEIEIYGRNQIEDFNIWVVSFLRNGVGMFA